MATAFPPPPVDNIDWANLKGAKVFEVNGHVESTYSRATGEWAPLEFVADPYIRIHGLAPGLNYGQQALEGLKAFRTPGTPGGLVLFRPERNAQRFQHSAEVLSMPPVPVGLFVAACRAAVALNGCFMPPHESGGSLYVRPQLYGTSAHLGLTAPDEYKFCVFVTPTGSHMGTLPSKALIVDDFDRAAPRGTGHAKVGGNYAPVLRWSDLARSQGFGLTLHLDSARHEEVDEFSTCGFIGVRITAAAAGNSTLPQRNGGGSGGGEEQVDEDEDEREVAVVTLVVPDSPCVIDSVTSDSVQRIARSLGWRVERRPIPYTELPMFSEVLGAGTAVALVPIRSITRVGGTAGPKAEEALAAEAETTAAARLHVQDGFDVIQYLPDEQLTGGPVYVELLTRLRDIQSGKIRDDFGWRLELGPEDLELPHRPQ